MHRTPRYGDGKRWSERGAVAVEFALCLLPLLMLVLGGVDLARAYNARNVLSQAAAEGARVLAIPSTNSVVRAKSAAESVWDFSGAIQSETVNGQVVRIQLIYPETPVACSSTSTAAAPRQAKMHVRVAFHPLFIPGLTNGFRLDGVGVQQCGY